MRPVGGMKVAVRTISCVIQMVSGPGEHTWKQADVSDELLLLFAQDTDTALGGWLSCLVPCRSAKKGLREASAGRERGLEVQGGTQRPPQALRHGEEREERRVKMPSSAHSRGARNM